jgi:hypothetical protein
VTPYDNTFKTPSPGAAVVARATRFADTHRQGRVDVAPAMQACDTFTETAR